jgi:hypothetical protein
VGAHLNIGTSGATIDSLSITLSNMTNTFNGVVNLTDDAGNAAQSIEFVLGSVPAGSGYVVTLYGSDSQGDPCSGASTPFTVTAGATANVVVNVTCTVPTDAAVSQSVDSGTVAVDASIALIDQPPFGCPAIAGVSISPAELLPPETATLGVVVTPGSGGVQTLLWSATCGNGTPAITNPTQPNATFSCGTAVATTCAVTLALGFNGTGLDGGSVGPVCSGVANTTVTQTIACEAQCATAADCKSTTACQVPSCTAGRCSFTPAAQGTACTDGGGSICDGAGTCVVPSFDVVRVGSGSGALSNTVTAPVFIDRYSLTGALLGTTPLPTTGAQSLTFAGDTAEGDLTTSANGKLLVVAGHNYAAGTTVSASSTTNPIAAFVGPGASPTITTLPVTGAFSTGGSVRSAVSLDGTQVWVVGTGAGTSAGLWYGPTNVQLVQTPSTKLGRILRIAGSPSQLYGDSNFNPPGLFTVGSGTPTSGTQTVTELPGLSALFDSSPFGYVFLTVGGVPTLYVVDDSTGGTGGIGKWTLSGGTWTLAWRVMGVGPQTDGGTTPMGYRGLAGYLTGSTVTLMASTGMAALMQDSLVVIVDTGLSTGPASQTVVATAVANTDFRGVAIPPHP